MFDLLSFLRDDLGITLNNEKCNFEPVNVIEYLGVIINTNNSTVKLKVQQFHVLGR